MVILGMTLAPTASFPPRVGSTFVAVGGLAAGASSGVPLAAGATAHGSSSEHMFSQRLGDLAALWHRECGLLSSTSARTRHAAFRAIVAMGDAAVPHLLRRLWEEKTDWDLALVEITGENPVAAGDEGDMRAIAGAWRAWGVQQRLISADDPAFVTPDAGPSTGG